MFWKPKKDQSIEEMWVDINRNMRIANFNLKLACFFLGIALLARIISSFV